LTPGRRENIINAVPIAPRLEAPVEPVEPEGGMAVRGGGRPGRPSRKHLLDSRGESQMAPKVPGPGRRRPA
jgi:hypothetical protein